MTNSQTLGISGAVGSVIRTGGRGGGAVGGRYARFDVTSAGAGGGSGGGSTGAADGDEIRSTDDDVEIEPGVSSLKLAVMKDKTSD